MWFGDLVTMKWWEGIWLNEAFATFMEISCSDAYRPDWRVWDTFCRGRSAAFATDALKSTRPIEYPVHTPAEAEGMFDVLTYEKGASVVRMLEQHLGAERFRDGVRHYLTTHAYANTETGDLWNSLEATSGEPVRRIMDGWIYQGGYPLVELTETPHGTAVSQRPFAFEETRAPGTAGVPSAPGVPSADERMWAVPLRTRGPGTGRKDGEQFLLDGPAVTLTGRSIDDFATANADAFGFFRVQPNPLMIATAASGELNASERHAVVDDAWALTVGGRMSAQSFVETALRFVAEDDPAVWQALAGAFGVLRRFVDGDPDNTSRYTRDVGELARGALDRIGLQPDDNDDDRVRELRATLVSLLGTTADDPQIITASPDLRHHCDATLAAAALTVVAHQGGRSEFNEIWTASKEATNPQNEQRNLRALADFRDTTLIDELLEAILSGAVRTQDGPYLIRRALANRTVGGHVWAFVASHWDLLTARFPSNSVARMLEGIVMLDSDDQVASVFEFLTAHPVPQGRRQVAQHLERQRINAAFRARVQQSEFWLRTCAD